MTENIKWIPFEIVESMMVKLLQKTGIPESDAKIVADKFFKKEV